MVTTAMPVVLLVLFMHAQAWARGARPRLLRAVQVDRLPWCPVSRPVASPSS